MDIVEMAKEFEINVPHYKAVDTEVRYIVEEIFRDSIIKIHSITSRVKKIESFIDKAKRKGIKEPFKEIKDIVGIRIICLFLTDIPKIRDKIRENFDVLEEDNKMENSELSSFGYFSVHFVAVLKKEYSGPRYNKIKDIPFEIQVRTIAMHAWASISHYLSYKTEQDIPEDLKKDFYALSGLFYVADSHFQIFYNARELKREGIEKDQNIFEEDLNLDTLTVYLKEVFPDREQCDSDTLSEVIKELNLIGIKKIKEIEDIRRKAWDAFVCYEKDQPPVDEEKVKQNVFETTVYNTVGILRELFELGNKDFYTMRRSRISNKYLNMVKK